MSRSARVLQQPGPLSSKDIAQLREALLPLVGTRMDVLSVPQQALAEFEPSQVGTIVGTLMDACLPYLEGLPKVGINKCRHEIGEREAYPDFEHESGKRLELKLLFVDNPVLKLKKPPTPREPSARVTQKVTIKNVDPKRDAMLLIAYRLEPDEQGHCSPLIVDLDLFPMIELVLARDRRMEEAGGRWFGDYETPTIPSKVGQEKLAKGRALNTTAYGRKESEGRDFNEDTNFGKLKRIPYKPLQQFLKRMGAEYARSGSYPASWAL